MDALLPDSTVGFVSATNSVRLTEQWNKTQLGKLMTEPAMKPFEEDLRAQLQAKWSVVADRLGTRFGDLRGVSTGEACLALLNLPPDAKGPNQDIHAGTCLLLDVTGNLNKAKALLAKARAGLKARGAKETVQTIRGIPVYVFDVPLPQAQQVAAGQGGAGAVAATGQTVCFLTEKLFAACDDLAAVRDILARLVNGGQAHSLSQVVAYQKVMGRCAADVPQHVPSIRWYIKPIGFAEAVRAATPLEKQPKGKTIIEYMRHQGYTAFQGIGGFVDVSADGYQIVHRTAVYAPQPYEQSMKMFVFPNAKDKDFTPQAWVGRDVATYFTVYVDILNAFDNFGPLYDEIIGEDGVWKQTLKGYIEDPNSIQTDIRKELVANLGKRVTMVVGYSLPITTTSERLLWAVELKDKAAEAAVAKAIEKCLKDDPTFKRREFQGHVIWEIVQEEETEGSPLKIDVPTLMPKKDDDKTKPDDNDDDQAKEDHFLPHGAITVAQGNLFVASHIDFLKKILKPLAADQQLATQPEFQKVWDVTFSKLGMSEQSSRSFSWTDRAVQPAYEMVRQGKMPQSESLLGRALNSLAAGGKPITAPRQQRIDGTRLPAFDVVGKALGPSTAAMTSEKDGWFIKGVLMTK
jgi:hypothetical protein